MIRLAPPTDRPLRVLALGAHADDIEIGCAGTLFRLQPIELHYVVLSAGPERAAEARASAAALGAAGVDVHAFRESYFPWAGADIKDAFEALKARVAPDVIFTPHRDDLHQDHAQVARLTWNTWRDHLILEYEIPKYEGELPPPNVYIPLTDAIARRKVDHLVDSFPSQSSRPWFRASTFEAILRLRGVECNAPWAEAFTARKIVW
ncbi:MAG TPA: PIG-L family deacetylase [Haliangiales bacterium]|nr:PIG-L family deacetylase [Haliangiales bacterium]